MTAIDAGSLESALGPVRALVEADGGELLLDRVDGNTAQLRLVLEGAECRECVMPKTFLEQVALDMLAPNVAGLAAVQIADPRED